MHAASAISRAEADRDAIAAATAFRFVGRGRYDEIGVFPTLEEARAAKAAAGRDEWCREPMIYAIAPGRPALFVE